MWSTIVPIGLSGFALCVSAITLWRAHLSRFNIVTAAGPMCVRIHKIQAQDSSWQLPHFAVSVSFTNSGAQIGKVLGVRAMVRYTALPIPGAHEVFPCQGEYEASLYWKHASKRFSLIDKARLGDFLPFVVLPKITVTKFYVFSTRWDTPVRQPEIEVDVEMITDKDSS